MAGVTLQAQCGQAHRQQVGIGRAMGVVTVQAVFRDRGMLVGEGTAILSMATQTELIHVRGAQVFARGSAMRIVAVGTAHLPFPQRVVIRQTHFSALALVTDRKSTRLNSSHLGISYAVFCL